MIRTHVGDRGDVPETKAFIEVCVQILLSLFQSIGRYPNPGRCVKVGRDTHRSDNARGQQVFKIDDIRGGLHQFGVYQPEQLHEVLITGGLVRIDEICLVLSITVGHRVDMLVVKMQDDDTLRTDGLTVKLSARKTDNRIARTQLKGAQLIGVE